MAPAPIRLSCRWRMGNWRGLRPWATARAAAVPAAWPMPIAVAVTRLEAVYLGPGEVLVAADVRMQPGLGGDDLTAVLAGIRGDAARELPVIARLYLTPVP